MCEQGAGGAAVSAGSKSHLAGQFSCRGVTYTVMLEGSARPVGFGTAGRLANKSNPHLLVFNAHLLVFNAPHSISVPNVPALCGKRESGPLTQEISKDGTQDLAS